MQPSKGDHCWINVGDRLGNEPVSQECRDHGKHSEWGVLPGDVAGGPVRCLTAEPPFPSHCFRLPWVHGPYSVRYLFYQVFAG